MSALICHNEQRRERVRQHRQLNGIDYLEVSKDQRTLTVYFLGKAPVEIGAKNVRIEGGRRIQNIRVMQVQAHHFKQIGPFAAQQGSNVLPAAADGFFDRIQFVKAIYPLLRHLAPP